MEAQGTLLAEAAGRQRRRAARGTLSVDGRRSHGACTRAARPSRARPAWLGRHGCRPCARRCSQARLPTSPRARHPRARLARRQRAGHGGDCGGTHLPALGLGEAQPQGALPGGGAGLLGGPRAARSRAKCPPRCCTTLASLGSSWATRVRPAAVWEGVGAWVHARSCDVWVFFHAVCARLPELAESVAPRFACGGPQLGMLAPPLERGRPAWGQTPACRAAPACLSPAERRSLCREDDELVGAKCEYALSQVRCGVVARAGAHACVERLQWSARAASRPCCVHLSCPLPLTSLPLSPPRASACLPPGRASRSSRAWARRWSSARAGTCGTCWTPR